MNDKKETESSGKDAGHGRGLLNIPQHSASCNMCAFSFVCTLVNVLVATGKALPLQSDDDLHRCKCSMKTSYSRLTHPPSVAVCRCK